jgi:Protein of unknown function (DUF1559)
MRTLPVIALFLAVPAFAQPGAASFSKQASPFIDEHTLVVVRVDVSHLDVDTVVKLATNFLGNGDEVGDTIKDAKSWVKEFTALGGKDLLLTYGAADFPNLPCILAPAPQKETDQKKLGELLVFLFKDTGKDGAWTVHQGFVCAGTKDALAVVKSRKPVDRPDLQAALDSGSEGVAQVAFAMSAEAKKIHEQVAPTLPAELGGGRVQVITRGLKWAALTIAPGPKMPAKLIIEATSPQAAQDLRGIETKAHAILMAQLLKGEQETDAAFQKRMEGLIRGSSSTQEGSRLTIEWELATTLLEAIKLPEGPPADRARSTNNLKQLVLAMHNYHDAYGRFPTDIRDKDGKPLLSWRVKILPFIEQEQLYKQFKLDEPWDSPNNKKLIDKMPKTFHSPRQAAGLKDKTTYLAPLGKGFIWEDPKGIKIFEISDGTSNTIALVEAEDERAVIWSKPEDISIDMKNPVSGLLGHYTEGFHAAMADGSVQFIKKSVDARTLWALFTKDGGEVVEFPK